MKRCIKIMIVRKNQLLKQISKLNNFLRDLSLIDVFDFANEQRDDELFFKVLIYSIVANIKNVIKNEFSSIMIVDSVRINVINEKT